MIEDHLISWLRSLLDVVIVASLIYRGLLVIRGTRAAPMLWGMTLIALLYFLARRLGLVTTVWILENLLGQIIIVAVIVFQDEIRRGLTKVGMQPLYRRNNKVTEDKTIEDITLVCSKFSRLKIGALMVIQREVGLDELLEEAVLLDANINRKLLLSIFIKESPLHDGAVLIAADRIKAAGCVLPLSFNPDLDPNLGTRHRAALGLSERSDALVIVVSEENGAITLVRDGRMFRNLEAAQLREALVKALYSKGETVTAEVSA